MKKILITVSIFFFLSNFSYSQSMYELKQAMDFFNSYKLQTGDWRTMLSENEIEGSPYLNDDFIGGTLYTVIKQQFVEIPLRYNIYNDQIEFKGADNQVQALAAPEIVEKVEFGNYKMVYLPFSILKKIRKGFFITLHDGHAALYLKPEVVFKQAVEPAAYKDAEPPAFVRKTDSFYIRVGEEQAKKVDNKKDLIEIFPNHTDKIEEFIKKNKTKTNDPESLKELVKYYNTL